MKKTLLSLGLLSLAAIASAQTWAPGIVIDGSVDEWDGQVPAILTDGSGDGGTGRDIRAVYLANDATNLYVRIRSWNADTYDGNEFSGVDGDSSAATGFNLFGLGLGNDTLVAGASVFGETTGSFNSGAATPGSVSFGPFGASTDVEFALPLSTTIPGDIAASFPGGLGSTIGFLYGDGNGGATDAASGSYTLATVPGGVPAGGTLDAFELYDSTANAGARTFATLDSGQAIAGFDTAAGVSGSALRVSYAMDATTAFARAAARHRFAAPLNVTSCSAITLDVRADASNPAADGRELILVLQELDGDAFGAGASLPTGTSFATLNFPAYGGGWFAQGFSTGDLTPDPDQIIGWYIAVGNSGAPTLGGTYVLEFDNLLAPGALPVALDSFSVD